ncbi:MAG: LysM peptidoglycan-binding domain-containing protein [Mariprofundus sp.]|nr:LysM peptidoglycan-binding domain-containing protein [Mariprofundus sp.]
MIPTTANMPIKKQPLFIAILAISFTTLILSGCSQAINTPLQATSKASYNNTEQKLAAVLLTDNKSEQQLKLTHRLPSITPIDALLAGIHADDLVMAKAQAKRNYQRSWKAIGIRSRFVRQRILATLATLNAPRSLQVIPIVESTYDPYALSQAGALGLWQLMPRTAHALGVRSDKKTNGRRNIIAATTAAVHYLQQMHQRFNNWPLAFAAYNMGPYALAKRLRKQPWQLTDGLENMPIPANTRAYVQHIIGLAALLHDDSLAFPEPINTRTLDIQAPVDIQRLAQLTGLPENDIFRFNPCLNQAQYLHQTITIQIPVANYDSMQNKLSLAGPIYVNKPVKAGDNLWNIARTHQTSVQTLQQLNQGLGKYLRIGQHLKVPANKLAQAIAEHNPLLSGGRRIRYKVRSGDSLWRIADRFGTTPKAIARSNQISMNRMIRIGDVLWVFAKKGRSS